jgi:hypothetical protein
MKTILTLAAAALAAVALAGPGSAAEAPGVTAMPAAQEGERYVPFVTDFPDYGHEAAQTRVSSAGAGGFDALDAALGAAAGLAVGALAAAALPARHRRRAVSSA